LALDSGTRLGPYEIIAAMGAGGMGEVYRARDTRLDRLVAVKILHAEAAGPQAFERFEREARAIAALNHPGICTVYDVGTSPVPFLVMELLDGVTLYERLLRGRIDVPTLVEIGLALSDALASAHGKGIVHRDLKPANIILTPRGPKILDFGLARIAETAPPLDSDFSTNPTLPAQAPLTDAGVAVGTAAYMSPEQLRGETLDVRTDLFSLGVVLYEAATGRRAFRGTTTAVTSAAILHEQPAAPRQLEPEIPARLEQAILTLLEKDREVRTQTASELRAELTRIKRDLSGVRSSDTATPAAVVVDPTGVNTTRSGVAAAAPPSSSDAQLIAGVIRRHRGAVLGLAAVIVVFALGAVYLATLGSGTTTADEAPDVSIANLQVGPLTTSGTAGSATITPNGDYVVYVESGGGRDSLRLRQVATASNVEIVPAQPGMFLRASTVTPDGLFANYVRQLGAQPPELWQVPLLGGAPRRLVEGIDGRVSFSPDRTQMTYVRVDNTGPTELMIAAPDGRGARVLATRRLTSRFWPFSVAWSPDGTTIAVLGARGGESPSGQVVFVDVKTGSERTADGGPPLIGTGLAWLDNGSLIVSRVEKPSAPMQLWLLSYPEGRFRRLTNDTSTYLGVSVSAARNELVTTRVEISFDVWVGDATATRSKRVVAATPMNGPFGFGLRWIGDDLVYVSGANGGFGLIRWRAATGTTEILAPGGGNPSASRDGGTIAFFDYDARELSTIDAAGTNRTTQDHRDFALSLAALMPDGRQFIIIGADGANNPAVRIAPVDRPETGQVVTADRVRVPGSLTGATTAAEVSPDGRRIAFASFDDVKRPTIAVCDLANCSSRQMFPAVDTWHWMPDNKSFAYVDPRSRSDLWSQPLDGGAARQVTHFAADGRQIWDFAWSADGQRLAVARATQSNNIVLFRGLRAQK
jgi:Tol biopolymer transport system component